MSRFRMGEIIAWPKAPHPLPFTGERLTSAYRGQTEIEHLHRYLLAREWCRDKDVLDVASGEGYGTALIAQVARNAVGVEIAPEAVEHASGAYQAGNLRFVVGDARSLPIPDASFDVVTSFETLEHFAEQRRFLSEVRRVLRPGGLLIVSTPDRDNYSPAESPANPFHVRELTEAEFEALLRSSFAEVSVMAQRAIFGSVMLPGEAGKAVPLCFERRGDEHFEGSLNLPHPQYMVGFASDEPVSPPPTSVYIDTGRLGMLRPQEADAALGRLRDQNAEIEPLRAALSAAREEARGLRASNDELMSVRDEAKGLLAANEMAERACAVLRHELAAAREEAKGLKAAKDDAERAGQEAERACETLRGELAACQENLARVRVSKRRIWPVRAFRELRRFGRRLGERS